MITHTKTLSLLFLMSVTATIFASDTESASMRRNAYTYFAALVTARSHIVAKTQISPLSRYRLIVNHMGDIEFMASGNSITIEERTIEIVNTDGDVSVIFYSHYPYIQRGSYTLLWKRCDRKSLDQEKIASFWQGAIRLYEFSKNYRNL